MEFLWALIIVSLISLIVVLIFAAIVRYAIDSSKTSRKLDVLIKEVHHLKTEIKQQQHLKQQDDSKHIMMRKYKKQNGDTSMWGCFTK
ncbi:hypothetical protein OM416_14910 [Paenibacillus sp. LS1]|uniref:hypothetical protein n=1 Tax=Paenibacillus sp. LS1 TaxID=2992120 RepID=UPI002231A62C|nr:hypothetical protein [Paenibacillus sp. LS1]MCW3792879.1 hypothetical protein [Paenibacillus sp. LS1]